MTRNVGKTDRKIRIVIGVLLIIGALMGYGNWMWIGVIPLVTGLMGSCLISKILGKDTTSADKA